MEKNKTCPFCKKTILKTAKSCPNCHRILIEETHGKIDGYQNAQSERSYQRSRTWHMPRFTSNFQMPKGNKPVIGWIIFFIVLAFAGKNHNPLPPDCANPPAGQVFNSLANGTVLNNATGNLNGSLNGQGKLEVNNGTTDDAIVKIVDNENNQLLNEVYVDANNSYIITGIPDGTYKLLFSLGKNWDSRGNKFQACKSYAKFDNNFQYQTTRSYNGDQVIVRIPSWRITLNPVVGGTAKTSGIDEKEFSRY